MQQALKTNNYKMLQLIKERLAIINDYLPDELQTKQSPTGFQVNYPVFQYLSL